MGVKSLNGIRRVNNSQRRIANDQISDAFVKVPFSNTKIKTKTEDLFLSLENRIYLQELPMQDDQVRYLIQTKNDNQLN